MATLKDLQIRKAYLAFLEADQAWSAQLKAKFGKDAGDKRYTKEGAALPGHAEFVRTNAEWQLSLIKDEV